MKKITREQKEELNRIKFANEKLITELKSQIHENKKKVQSVKEKAKELKKELKLSKQSHDKVVNLLEQSEKERLELRDKYMKLGEKMESIAEMDLKLKESDHAKYKDKIARLKEKIHIAFNEKKSLKRDFKEQMKSKQEELDGTTQEIQNLNKKAEEASREHEVTIANLATAKADLQPGVGPPSHRQPDAGRSQSHFPNVIHRTDPKNRWTPAHGPTQGWSG